MFMNVTESEISLDIAKILSNNYQLLYRTERDMDHREHDQLLKKMVEAELDADAAAQQVTALRDVCQRLKEVKD